MASAAKTVEVEGMDVTQARRAMRLMPLTPEVMERLVDPPDTVLEKVIRHPLPSD